MEEDLVQRHRKKSEFELFREFKMAKVRKKLLQPWVLLEQASTVGWLGTGLVVGMLLRPVVDRVGHGSLTAGICPGFTEPWLKKTHFR
jgi:hypothetical protein